ncbi:MAG: aspartate aminotransferase family protein [Pseudomonadota bacterium]
MTAAEFDPRAGVSQAQFDAHWMPFTGNRQFKKDPRMLVAAEGRYYQSADGRRIFDGLSGLWTCGLGHGRAELADAVAAQMRQLDYSPAFQFAQPKSFQLAEKIASFMPEGLNRIFYTGSGSESVETALKIARAYWHKHGKASKTRLIGRAKGYHGVNFGGISVGGLAPNRALYGGGIDATHLPHTITPENHFSRGMPEHGAHLADRLEDMIAMHDASTIAAVIVEPMAGSAGVIPPPQGYLQKIRDICDRHNILLIFDEVICAFGRVGAKTGAEAFGVTPDIITMAKQLTNGTIPMGAVAFREDIYNTFMEHGGPEYALELPHGYTYSAHPVACAAGLAALDLSEKEDSIAQVQAIAPYFEEAAHALKGAPWVADIRNCGLAVGITLEHAPGEPLKRPYEVGMSLWEKGFYVRYGGDTVQIAPAFAVTRQEIDSLFNALGETLEELGKE